MATYTELRELREKLFAQCAIIAREIDREVSYSLQICWSDESGNAGALLSGLAQAVRLLDDELKAMKPQDAPPPQDELRNGVILLED